MSQQNNTETIDAGAVEKRDIIAAAIVDLPLAEFREWAANGTTYPNAYQCSIDMTYAQADRVLASLRSRSENNNK